MVSYPGMSLRGEIRESISLDEDDLSDVEDEVFIRDGKNGYKFAEDIGVKRPLMAPRRKLNKPDLKSRLKNRPPCRPFCKPCCYIFGALTVLIGVIVLVVIIVSMFPLPIDKIKNWIVTKSKSNVTVKLLPCSELRVTDVWTVSLPKLTSESSIRSLDIDGDGIDDLIFGFGTGDNSILHQDIFCPMFMGVASPCGGGVMALNGSNGQILWKRHLTHTTFTIFCSYDLDGDLLSDCIVTGKGGIFTALNSRNGSTIWDFEDKDKDSTLLMDIYTANFIPDQDNDNVADVIAAHTLQKGRIRSGHIIVISGKTGKEIQRVSTPNLSETYYLPQLLPQKNGQYYVLFGTGSPSSPGNLTIIPLKELLAGNHSFQTIYQDTTKGVLSPSVLVDITGDGQLDIVAAMFHSTVVAIDGSNFEQLWNVSINNSETLSTPTPGFFNDDNVTDFLIKYQTGPEFPIYYYSQTFIINGKTGQEIYSKPIVDSVGSQMAGLTISMESYGYDFFLYWIGECKNFEGRQDIYEFLPGSTLKEQSNSDLCKLRFNSTKLVKLYALNQFFQPPGIEIYSSDNRSFLEYNNSKSPVEEATEYLTKHPEVQVQTNVQTPETDVTYNQKVENLKTVKYKDGSPFRHKDNNQGLIKDYAKPERNKVVATIDHQKFDPIDYEQPQETWQPKINYPENIPNYQPDDMMDYNAYLDDNDPLPIYNQNKLIPDNNSKSTNRDIRGDSDNNDDQNKQKTLKKNLSDDKYGIYDYKNIQQSRNRLLHDLSNVPTDILKDTYFKNRERQLRKSKLEQRDVKSHIDKMKENEDIKQVIENERRNIVNTSENLWDLETEKEIEDRKNGYWRGKREAKVHSGIQRISSIGVLLKSLDSTKNSIDLVFLTYWTPPKNGPQLLIEKDYQCISTKIKNALNSKEEFMNSEKATLEELFKKECLEERGVPAEAKVVPNTHNKPNFPYYNQISQLSLGQMTVYRIRIECLCEVLSKEERCAKFLNPNDGNGWSEYMSKLGNGIFYRN